MSEVTYRYCPYCGFRGTEAEVDEHRTYAHQDEPQKGSNLKHRPREEER